RFESHQQTGQCRLTGTAGSDDSHPFPGIEIKVDPLQYFVIAKGLANVPVFDNRFLAIDIEGGQILGLRRFRHVALTSFLIYHAGPISIPDVSPKERPYSSKSGR